MPAPSVAVVIPLYTTDLGGDARLSLARTFETLGHHRLVLACPESLDLAPLQPLFGDVVPEVERFAPGWFASLDSYNRLMLSAEFYDRFAAFDFILICQTDVFVFDDRLEAWVARGYDYVGAPWIASPRTWWRSALLRFNNLFRKRKKAEEHLFKVGNGGFSLRRVSVMRRVVRELRADIDHQLANPCSLDHWVEDVYFSLLAPAKLEGGMRIPGWEEALDFCIDRRPKIAMRLSGGRLPFACHGFDKRDRRGYWRPILQRISGVRID